MLPFAASSSSLTWEYTRKTIYSICCVILWVSVSSLAAYYILKWLYLISSTWPDWLKIAMLFLPILCTPTYFIPLTIENHMTIPLTQVQRLALGISDDDEPWSDGTPEGTTGGSDAGTETRRARSVERWRMGVTPASPRRKHGDVVYGSYRDGSTCTSSTGLSRSRIETWRMSVDLESRPDSPTTTTPDSPTATVRDNPQNIRNPRGVRRRIGYSSTEEAPELVGAEDGSVT